MSLVQFIRDITGAPDDPKWNSVLFGGNGKLIFDVFIFLHE